MLLRNVTSVTDYDYSLVYNGCITNAVNNPVYRQQTGWYKMEKEFVYIKQLEELIDSFPPDSILSRMVYQDDFYKNNPVRFSTRPGTI